MPADPLPLEESPTNDGVAAEAPALRPGLEGWRLLACAVLLNAGIAAVFGAGFAKIIAPEASPRIASVRLGELVDGHIEGAVRDTEYAETLAVETREWALALEAALHAVAIRHGVVLLPARSVAAGAEDLTGAVEAELARLLAEDGS